MVCWGGGVVSDGFPTCSAQECPMIVKILRCHQQVASTLLFLGVSITKRLSYIRILQVLLWTLPLFIITKKLLFTQMFISFQLNVLFITHKCALFASDSCSTVIWIFCEILSILLCFKYTCKRILLLASKTVQYLNINI